MYATVNMSNTVSSKAENAKEHSFGGWSLQARRVLELMNM
jgi:hypothetical protein